MSPQALSPVWGGGLLRQCPWPSFQEFQGQLGRCFILPWGELTVLVYCVDVATAYLLGPVSVHT